MSGRRKKININRVVDWKAVPFVKITTCLCLALFAYMASQMRFDSVKSADKRKKIEESRRSDYIRCEQRLSKEIARKKLKEKKK